MTLWFCTFWAFSFNAVFFYVEIPRYFLLWHSFSGGDGPLALLKQPGKWFFLFLLVSEMIFVQTQTLALRFYKFSSSTWCGNGLTDCYFVNFHHFPTKAWLTSLGPVALNVELVPALASSICSGRVSNECGCLREWSEQGAPGELPGILVVPREHLVLTANYLGSLGPSTWHQRVVVGEGTQLGFEWSGILAWAEGPPLGAVLSVPALCWLRRWVMLNSLDHHPGPKWLRWGSERFIPWCRCLDTALFLLIYLFLPDIALASGQWPPAFKAGSKHD